MTEEEIRDLRFNMVANMNMDDQHVSTYVCENAPAGHQITVTTIVNFNETTHGSIGCETKYSIDNEAFENYDEFKQKLLQL